MNAPSADASSNGNRPARLLERLDAIGRYLSASGKARCLLALGSVGLETDRLDEFSDLDFFVIAKDGCKEHLIRNLDWLSQIHPLAFSFQNTVDGHKVLFADGLYAEFAVFVQGELPGIPFAPGRVVWKEPGFDERVLVPTKRADPPSRDRDWLLNEALTNLYVGLCRDARNERLSAMRLIQVHAVDRVLELAESAQEAGPVSRDEFAIDRRAEARLAGIAAQLPNLCEGYSRNRESALAILDWLSSQFSVSPALATEITRLGEVGHLTSESPRGRLPE